MANDSSVIVVSFNETTHMAVTRPVYQYDHGLTIQVHGLGDVVVDQIHFSNTDTGKALNILASTETDGSISVLIPDTLQAQDKNIHAFIYVEDSTSGYTVKVIRIPMIPRAKPETLSMDSPQMGAVNQLTQELNALIETVEELEDSTNQATQNATSAATSANNAASNANQKATAAQQATSSANTAAQNAQTAANKLNSISFDINIEDGCLYMTTS